MNTDMNFLELIGTHQEVMRQCHEFTEGAISNFESLLWENRNE